MKMISGTLHGLLLAGTCLCVYGTPVRLPTEDSACDGLCSSSVTPAGSTHVGPSDSDKFHPSELVTDLIADVGAKGGADPHGRKAAPVGIALMTQTETENGDRHVGRSGPSESGREAWSRRIRAEAEAQRRPGVASELSESEPAAMEEAAPFLNEPTSSSAEERGQLDVTMSSPRSTLLGFPSSSSSVVPPQMEAYSLGLTAWEASELTQGGGDRERLPGLGESLLDADEETSRPPFTDPAPPSMQRPGAILLSPRASTPLSGWGQEGVTLSTLLDPLLPEMGPNLMSREGGPDSLWTEAARPSGVDTMVPLSQDDATEGTMSSEALPLIFEPFDDITPEAAAAITLVPGGAQPPAAMATGGMPLSEVDLDQLVTVETDSDGPSHAPPLLIPDWTSPWQTSGAELLEPINPSGPSVSQQQVGTEPGPSEAPPERDAERTKLPHTTRPSLSSAQHALTAVTMATHRSVSKSRSGLEEMESEEEANEEEEEEEEEENSEESEEEESEEDLAGTPKTASTQPPYSLIPPPPVWVQRNQGLMRSWVELIREKAGYVSGMLAPVGIGITGALLIVGALYTMRMIHRKRRNSFKHQRRKQPREPSSSRQDQAMLLADSSEDEF
ncbi:uncharacterized protein armh4 isoform X2 [Genypterus blacodes]|uniref:uncharacterized protein armh4 isoform X2 n=1 Tax=Genypterus blacodes TaxID=154954 RepID=UPI003F769EEF